MDPASIELKPRIPVDFHPKATGDCIIRSMNYIRLIRESVDYIEFHLSNPLSLDEMASRCHLSKFYFSRIFKALTHRPLKDYILERRMVYAACRLRHSRDKIIDIALACGFRSHEVFSRNFRQYSGMAPVMYRRCTAPDLPMPEKAHISERSFKNIHRNFVTACTFIHLQETNLFHRSCRFNPNEAAGINSAAGCVSNFVDAYMSPHDISPLYTVSISENCSAANILFHFGYEARGSAGRRGLHTFVIPASRYAVFHYHEDFGNIFRCVIDDILLSLAARNLEPAKCGIDFFQRYDADYQEKGFQVFIPLAS